MTITLNYFRIELIHTWRAIKLQSVDPRLITSSKICYRSSVFCYSGCAGILEKEGLHIQKKVSTKTRDHKWLATSRWRCNNTF